MNDGYGALRMINSPELTEPSECRVGWPGGLAPPGSHRTERDSLPSLRSSHRNSANANVRTHRQWANSAGSCLTIPSHHA